MSTEADDLVKLAREYAFDGLVYGEKSYWAASYVRLGDARRAAKEWVNRTPSKTASLLLKESQAGEIGATWKKVGEVKWTT